MSSLGAHGKVGPHSHPSPQLMLVLGVDCDPAGQRRGQGHATQGWSWDIWALFFSTTGEVRSRRVDFVFRAHLIVLEVVTGFVSPTLLPTIPCGHCSLLFFFLCFDGLLFPSLSHGIIPSSPFPSPIVLSLPAGHPSGGGGEEQPDVQVHHP